MYKVDLVDSSEFKDGSKYYKHLLKTYCQWNVIKYLVYSIIWLIGGRVRLIIQCERYQQYIKYKDCMQQ
ncbi:unnamed protein product [Paramecium sonneborni]|uniref:Uncharacterized protein n=1 Tax=Paramecium sonneborni TaxID=65129 RepID=A0A8S1RAP0_9CILI|nr:unnamed protein product [Paramecium sonneborni]